MSVRASFVAVAIVVGAAFVGGCSQMGQSTSPTVPSSVSSVASSSVGGGTLGERTVAATHGEQLTAGTGNGNRDCQCHTNRRCGRKLQRTNHRQRSRRSAPYDVLRSARSGNWTSQWRGRHLSACRRASTVGSTNPQFRDVSVACCWSARHVGDVKWRRGSGAHRLRCAHDF